MATISVGLAAVMAWRVLFPKAPPPPPSAARRQVPDWQRYATGRHSFGPADAPVTIIAFADFECPGCRAFALDVLHPLRAEHGANLRWVFRHWPLSYHRFARPAARAAECAADQGRFEAFHDVIYRGQDSLGLKSWVQFAASAGIPDTAGFVECNARTETITAVEEGLGDALQLRGGGTPLVIVNGIQFPGVPSRRELGRIVDSVIAARVR